MIPFVLVLCSLLFLLVCLFVSSIQSDERLTAIEDRLTRLDGELTKHQARERIDANAG